MVKRNSRKKKVNRRPTKANPKQEKFCRFYAQNTKLFGNATLSYAVAFGYDLESLSHDGVYSDEDEFGKRELLEDSPYTKAYNVCKSEGNRLLTYPYIDERIKRLLNETMTPENADAELQWVMSQRKELGPKVQALREFNKLKGRIIEKSQVDVTGLNLTELYNTTSENE